MVVKKGGGGGEGGGLVSSFAGPTNADDFRFRPGRESRKPDSLASGCSPCCKGPDVISGIKTDLDNNNNVAYGNLSRDVTAGRTMYSYLDVR